MSDTHQGLISDRCLYFDDAPYYYTVIIIIIYHINPLVSWNLKAEKETVVFIFAFHVTQHIIVPSHLMI